MTRLTAVGLLVASLSTLSAQSPGSANPSAKIWVNHYQEIEDYLRTAECVRIEVLGANRAARCTLPPGGPVARMAWKPLPPGIHRGFRESYKTEIAAYELDKLMRLDMVPPTVERQLQGNKGAAQLWVENVTGTTMDPAPDEPGRRRWESQVVRMAMFDTLIGNHERNRANMLRDAGWNLILIDHSRAFGTDGELRSPIPRIDEDLWARIERLTRDQLDRSLGAWLDEDQIAALLYRREKMRTASRSPR